MIVLVAVVAAGMAAAAGGTALTWWWLKHHDLAPAAPVARVRHAVRGHRHLAAVLRRHVDPAAATAVILAAIATVLVVVTVVLGLLLLAATSEEVTGRTDSPVAEWAAERATDTATDVVRALSDLGGTEGIVLVALAVGAVELRRTPTWGIPVLLVTVVGGIWTLVWAIKELVDRARPELLQLTGFAGQSFPSGHAAAAAATYACCAMLLARRRSRPVRAVLGGTAIGVAVTVAATRVALGVHWSTDVVAGLVLGWGWFALCSIAVGGRHLRFGEPVEVAEAVADRR